MQTGISRLAVISSVLLAGAVTASAQAPRDSDETLQQQLDTWFQQAQRRAPGEWGIAVADQQGRLVWGIQPTRPMIPASTVKLLTTGYGRTVLGADARVSTRVLGRGQVDPTTGTFEGSWALELNGDPTLEHRGTGVTSLTDLAAKLAQSGVKKLTGPLVVTSAAGTADATFPATWSVRHQGRLFAPPVGNLTLHDNLVEARVGPGAKIGQKVQLLGAAPDGAMRLFSVTAKTVAGKRSRLRIESKANGHYLVAGTLGIRAGTRGLARVMTDTRAVLEAAWSLALERAGIEWNPAAGVGKPEPGLAVLAEVHSPVFDSIASEVNRRSLNLGAELMLQWAAGSRSTAAERLTAHVQQITGDPLVRLVDGSGLSDLNRVAPYTFVSYLARFPQVPAGRNFPMLLPMNGSGTLARLGGLPQKGVVRAKTGTLGNVATLVGYLGRSDGVLLVSLMYHGDRVHAARQQQWSLFRTLGADGTMIPSDSAYAEGQLGGEPRS